MSKTVLCVLLKVLISARADISPKDPDSNITQDILISKNNDYHILLNLKSNRSHPDSVNMRNKIDEIPFTNMSVIPESIESILSKPTSPRAFVEFYNGFLNEKDNISVTFRWNQPESTDEIIQGYTVQCWFIKNQKKIQICNDKNISATILECTVHDLKPNTTYYFQVRAHTKVGAGPYTDLFNISTTHENPIPQLLTVSDNGIDKWDLDSNISVSLVEDRNVTSIAYSIAEHKIYWSNFRKELMMLDMSKNNTKKIVELQYVAINICIDWVARNLYLIEMDVNGRVYIRSYMMKLDLTRWENGIVMPYNQILKTEAYEDQLLLLPSIEYVNFYPFEINGQYFH